MPQREYRFHIDGVPRPASQNNFSALTYYGTKGCRVDLPDARWGTQELRSFLVLRGIDINADEWETILPNGKTIGARRFDKKEN